VSKSGSDIPKHSTQAQKDLEMSNVTEAKSNSHSILQNKEKSKSVNAYSHEKYVKSNTLNLHMKKRTEPNVKQTDSLTLEEHHEKRVKLEYQRREAQVKRRVSLDKSRNNYIKEQQRRAEYQKRLEERSGLNSNKKIQKTQQSKIAWQKEQQELQSRAKFVQRVKNQHSQE